MERAVTLDWGVKRSGSTYGVMAMGINLYRVSGPSSSPSFDSDLDLGDARISRVLSGV